MAELDVKTVEHILHPEVRTSGNTLSTIGNDHEQEDDHLHHGKKLSVLAKVKEKAKKWRQNLARKKSGHDHEVSQQPHRTPSWGVALEDYIDEDEPDHNLETLDTKHERVDTLTSGKQIYTKNTEKSIDDNEMKQKLPTIRLRTIRPTLGKSYSDHAVGNPSTPKDSINDAPRAQSLGNHLRQQHPSPTKFTLDTLIAQRKSNNKTEKTKKLPSPEEIMLEETTGADIITEKEEHSNYDESTDFEEIISNNDEDDGGNITAMSSEKIISEAKSSQKEALAPSYATATEAINDINSSTRELSVEAPQGIKEEHATATEAINDINSSTRELPVEASKGIKEEHATATEAINDINSSTRELSVEAPQGIREEQEWDKGVSVKEYFKNKLEPGEDEKALSQVISEVISPKRSPTEKGVVEKVKTAMSMLLQNDEASSPSSSVKSSRSSSLIPVSVNAHEVEEEGQEGGLQAN